MLAEACLLFASPGILELVALQGEEASEYPFGGERAPWYYKNQTTNTMFIVGQSTAAVIGMIFSICMLRRIRHLSELDE